MRFPSLTQLADRATTVLRRFPWTMAVAAVATVTAIESNRSGVEAMWERLAFVAVLGIPLSIALALLGEERAWPSGRRVVMHLSGLLGLALFYWWWPGMRADVDALRYFQLAAVLHLMVAFLPFLRGREGVGFWQYNNLLFMGALRAGVFSAVLFGGTAIALASLDKLFGVTLYTHIYMDVFLTLALFGTTWIFLAAVPEDVTGLDHAITYPRPLKVFAQYILTPLALGYLLILVAYLVKTLVVAEWPNGWIGWLVASVSVTGILGFLLVHPLRADPAEGWIRVYSRWLFLGLIPAALMLLAAFWKRIVPYGLTEPRVLGVLLGLWLLGIAIYFTARAEAGIRTIPITLAVLLAATLVGPLTLTRFALTSQRDRLVRMLALTGDAELQGREASGALRFLLERRDSAGVAAVFGVPVAFEWSEQERMVSGHIDSLATALLATRGLTYRAEWLGAAPDDERLFGLDSDAAIPVEGFTWILPLRAYDTTLHIVGTDTVRLLTPPESSIALVTIGQDTLHFDIRTFAKRALAAEPPWRTLDPSMSRLDAVEGGRRTALVLTDLRVHGRDDSLRVMGWGGQLLLTPRP